MNASMREQLGALFGGMKGACARKQQYRTREYAQRVADVRMQDRHDAPKMLYVYRCRVCGHFHLTQMDPHE